MSGLDLQEKATPDTGALAVSPFAVQASQKVQLDVDDAPFLMAEAAPPADLPAERKASALATTTQSAPAPSKRKRVLVAVFAVLLVSVIVSVVIWFVYFRTPPVGPPVKAEPIVIVVPEPAQIMGRTEQVYVFEPFMVEQHSGGNVRFLQARFTAVMDSEALRNEVVTKKIVLRDAIYYYLRNKTHDFLLDPTNIPSIKQDLIDIADGYLAQGKLQDVLLEHYILK